MKIITKISFGLLLFASFTMHSQNLFDQNTELIQSYFSQKNSISTDKSPSNTGMLSKPDVYIEQTGDYNETYINSHAEKKQHITQTGNNNTFEFYSYYDSNPTTINSLQYGDNNNIQVFGQNELSKNINIIQKTNDKTLIIKNY